MVYHALYNDTRRDDTSWGPKPKTCSVLVWGTCALMIYLYTERAIDRLYGQKAYVYMDEPGDESNIGRRLDITGVFPGDVDL